MNITTIQKWGNSYAVRLPKAAVEKLKLRAGQSVRIQEKLGRSLVIEPVPQKAASLADLVTRITSTNGHDAVDWSADVGKEAW